MDGLETALQYVQRDVARIDRIPRPVVAIGLKQVANRLEVSEHQHRRCELIYTVKGVLTCEIERSLWTVPPDCR